MKLRILLLPILFSLLAANLPAADELPIGFTEEEWENRHLIYDMGGRQTDPPMEPIRNIAEFERMQGVLIRYPLGISTAIISEMSEDVTVYCLVSSSQQSTAYNSFNNAGVNMDNVEFIIGPTDSYWTRDYGPWWVVDGAGEVAVVDHTYNRPRPNDNQAPFKMSEHLGTDYYDSDIISAGGNYMQDSYVIASSTTLIYEENPGMTQEEVDQLFQDYYGIENYYTVEDPNGEYIDHIDCWGKFLSPSKILLREVPASHSQYDEIEETVNFYETHLNAFGEPYEIFRVWTPQNQPYTNSLILNNKVIVPIMNGQWDDEALAAYEDAMPGYEVLGFTGSWQSTDALHCRAKGIPDIHMLQIFHNPIDDQEFPLNEYAVTATIDDLSQAGLIDDQVYLGWKNSLMEDYEMISLTPTGNSDEYSAAIPSQPVDTEVHYYIHAADNSGRSDNLPIAGYFAFDAIGGEPAQTGDVNMDGVLNVLDIVQVVSHILGTTPLTGYALILADVNGDEVVNVLDVIAIINLILT
ncbi:MAG: agmatine deiminase family protein [FCB group bacterium]|nr:agmatine deiminase family protein [FCB group bacterium]